jgi:hypothetical protein
VAIHQGKVDDAIALYEAQLELADRIGDPTIQSHAHAGLGSGLGEAGRPSQSGRALRTAVAHRATNAESPRRSERVLEHRLGPRTPRRSRRRRGGLGTGARDYESLAAPVPTRCGAGWSACGRHSQAVPRTASLRVPP